MTAAQLHAVAGLARRYGNGELRTTVMQNLVLVNVPTNQDAGTGEGVASDRLPVEGSSFWRGAIACTGTEFCKLAITETKGFTRWIVDELEDRLPGFDQQLKLHVTGCPNSCGQHWIADIGMEGKKLKHEGKWKTPITSAWAVPLDCINRRRGRLDIAAWQRKCPMRWSVCWVGICRRASQVKICARISRARVMSNCANSWPVLCLSRCCGMLHPQVVSTLSDPGHSTSLFPMFLKLEGKRCLVVGAGPIGLEKVESLLRCGPHIRVIAPEAVAQVRAFHAERSYRLVRACLDA